LTLQKNPAIWVAKNPATLEEPNQHSMPFMPQGADDRLPDPNGIIDARSASPTVPDLVAAISDGGRYQRR